MCLHLFCIYSENYIEKGMTIFLSARSFKHEDVSFNVKFIYMPTCLVNKTKTRNSTFRFV